MFGKLFLEASLHGSKKIKTNSCCISVLNNECYHTKKTNNLGNQDMEENSSRFEMKDVKGTL